jgi:hypothetical protein
MRNSKIEELKRWLESTPSARSPWSTVQPDTKAFETSDVSDRMPADSEAAEQRVVLTPAESLTNHDSVDGIIEPVPAAQALTSPSELEPFEAEKSNLEIKLEPTSEPGGEAMRSGSASDEAPTPDSASLSSEQGELRSIEEDEVGSRISELVSELVSDLSGALFSLRSAQTIAALWIDGSEQVAKQGVELQAKATEWSKNTMLAPVFEIQNAIARSWAELSANTARRLWKLK